MERFKKPKIYSAESEDEPSQPFGPAKPPPKNTTKEALSTEELNKLKAKAIKAKLRNDSNADDLEAQYQREQKRSHTEVISDIDIHGKYTETSEKQKEKKRKKFKETHDSQGNRLHYYQGDDQETLNDLVREEKLNSSHNLDKIMLHQIQKDSTLTNDLDYFDDSLDRMGNKHEVKAVTKRQYSLNEQEATEKALEKCLFCYTPEKAPEISVVALGNKVYLGLPDTIDLVPGHCFIVPTNHVLTSVECEDDVWDEIRNFMKTLIQMFSTQKKSVIFMEQAVYFKYKRHCVIECIPIPDSEFNTVPAYFKEGILQTAPEWSQNRKIIDTEKKGIRRSLVKDLPYFHVWFNHNGGIGHVIEDEKAWPSWFGREIIAGILDIDPSRWRRPKKVEQGQAAKRLAEFKQMYDPFNWTKLLDD